MLLDKIHIAPLIIKLVSEGIDLDKVFWLSHSSVEQQATGIFHCIVYKVFTGNAQIFVSYL